jgi:hypothetical protein
MSADHEPPEAEATADPVVLDTRRGMAAQKATESRRHLAEIEADQAARRSRQEELEKFLLASPAETWIEAAGKARYLLTVLAATSAGRDPRRRRIIAGLLDDFTRLMAAEAKPPAQVGAGEPPNSSVLGEERHGATGRPRGAWVLADWMPRELDGAERMPTQDRAEPRRKPEGKPELRPNDEARQQAGELDRIASRKAVEGSRGKRRRGGGLEAVRLG